MSTSNTMSGTNPFSAASTISSTVSQFASSFASSSSNAPTLAGLATSLAIATQGGNGPNVYSNEKALFGYVEAHERLQLSKAIKSVLPDPPKIDLHELGEANGIQAFIGTNGDKHRNEYPYLPDMDDRESVFTKLFIMNFKRLVAGNISQDSAGISSLLRARWMILGAYYKKLEDRAVTYDEEDIIKATDGTDAAQDATDLLAIPENLPALNWLDNNNDKTAWVIKYAENIWCMVEFIYRVRGHHYKADLEENYKTVWKAISEEHGEWPAGISMEACMRTAIHPFGVKALPVMAAHFISHGKVGEAIIQRMSGGPNGVAGFTTLAAGLHALASEVWYPQFYSNFSEPIDFVFDTAREILDDKYAYHISARLYGLTKNVTIRALGKVITMAEADSIINAVAPAVQGFITFNKEQAARAGAATFAMANAKVLEKRASTNPMQAIRVAALLEQSISSIREARDTNAAIKGAFPSLAPASPST